MTRGAGDPRLTQIVLAAGRSRRMGRPKALLRFGKQTALELILRAGLAVAARARVVVSSHGPDRGELRDLGLGELPLDVVLNPALDVESIDSLRCALLSSPLRSDGAFFVHPVDVPLVSGRDYETLAAAWREDVEGRVSVFKPQFEDQRGHPILVRSRVAGRILRAERSLTLRELLRDEVARSVPVTGPGVLEDMDTPEDYRRLVRLHEDSGDSPDSRGRRAGRD